MCSSAARGGTVRSRDTAVTPGTPSVTAHPRTRSTPRTPSVALAALAALFIIATLLRRRGSARACAGCPRPRRPPLDRDELPHLALRAQREGPAGVGVGLDVALRALPPARSSARSTHLQHVIVPGIHRRTPRSVVQLGGYYNTFSEAGEHVLPDQLVHAPVEISASDHACLAGFVKGWMPVEKPMHVTAAVVAGEGCLCGDICHMLCLG